MPFPFTFRLSVPGLHNPFSAAAGAQSEPGLRQTPASDRHRASQTPVYHPSHISTQIPLPPHRRTLASTPYSLSLPVPLARKRGWVPSSPEPCQATTSATSTNGYLDTPAKYRHMPKREPEREMEEMIADLPPAKRRRTLAGSIVSTALSAALIGTAVGLTVYRLWRDRGKDTPKSITNTNGTKESEHLPPPPPYHRGDWVPMPEPPKQIEITPPTPQVRSPKSRHHVSASARRAAVRQRRIHAKPRATTPPRGVSPSHSHPHAYSSLSSPPRSAFDFACPMLQTDETVADPDFDEMDWIGDRLSQLIEEGQKALSREIVVMSDAKEDEVDDGSGNWEEEQDPFAVGPCPPISRRGSVRSLRRTQRPRDLALGLASSSSFSPPSSSSPRKRRFEGESIHVVSGVPVSTPSTPRRADRGVSVESESHGPAYVALPASFRENESAWESPELRESMARARAQYLESRRMA